MELSRIFVLVLVLSVFSVAAFPSTVPLNERSTELTWQAWLLLDDQNQNKPHESENGAKRRIRPKSVFIAPTFNPDRLPPCAEGYTSDPRGNCIKIIKLDEDAQLSSILEHLNLNFGGLEILESEIKPTPGPYQLNIPLDNDRDYTKMNNDDNDEESEIAIVVAPTNNLNYDDTSIKLEKRQEQPFLSFGSRFGEIAGTTSTTEHVKIEVNIDETKMNENDVTGTTTNETETTTVLPETTTVLPETSTVNEMTETNSIQTQSTSFEDLGTTTEVVPTSTELNDVTTDQITSTEDYSTNSYSTTTEEVDTSTILSTSVENGPVRVPIRFTDNFEVLPSETVLPTETLLDFIRFPDDSNIHTRDTLSQMKNIENVEKVEETKPSFFPPETLPKPAGLGFENSSEKPLVGTEPIFNHRSRDKNPPFRFPTSWSSVQSHNFQKPIVLRISRNSYVNYNQFNKSPDYYRAVPPNFSYLFGTRNRHFSNG